jgi:hypothetical protein
MGNRDKKTSSLRKPFTARFLRSVLGGPSPLWLKLRRLTYGSGQEGTRCSGEVRHLTASHWTRSATILRVPGGSGCWLRSRIGISSDLYLTTPSLPFQPVIKNLLIVSLAKPHFPLCTESPQHYTSTISRSRSFLLRTRTCGIVSQNGPSSRMRSSGRHPRRRNVQANDNKPVRGELYIAPRQ